MSARMGLADRVAQRGGAPLAWGSALDFAFLLVCAASLALASMFAAAHLSGNALAVCLLEAPVLVVLCAGAWPRRVVIAGMAAALATLGAMAAVFSLSAPGSLVLFTGDDAARAWIGSAVFATTVLVSPVACFLVSRREGGWVALLAICVAMGVAAQILRGDWIGGAGVTPGAIATACSIVGAYGLGACRPHVDAEGSTRALAISVASSTTLSLAASIMAVALFSGVVQPLHVAAVRVRPLLGASVPDPTKSGDTPIPSGGNANPPAGAGDALDWRILPIIACALLGLVVIGLGIWLLATWLRRKRALEKIAHGTASEQVCRLYSYAVRDLRASGLLNPGLPGADTAATTVDQTRASGDENPGNLTCLTPRELAARTNELAPHAPEGLVSLTEMHERACYAGQPASMEDAEALFSYCRAIPSAARRALGWRAWIRAISLMP